MCIRDRVGTAYRIRTGDLRLERAASWASRRMRQGGPHGPMRAPTGSRCYQSRRRIGKPGRRPGCRATAAARLQAVGLQEGPDAVSDLAMALGPEHQAIVRMRAVLLV